MSGSSGEGFVLVEPKNIVRLKIKEEKRKTTNVATVEKRLKGGK